VCAAIRADDSTCGPITLRSLEDNERKVGDACNWVAYQDMTATSAQGSQERDGRKISVAEEANISLDGKADALQPPYLAGGRTPTP
jgi:hypothetical protein